MEFTNAQKDVLGQVESMWKRDGRPEEGEDVYSVAFRSKKTLDAIVASGVGKEYWVMDDTDTGYHQAALTINFPKFVACLKNEDF